MKQFFKLMLAATFLACSSFLCHAGDINVKSGKMPLFSKEQTVNIKIDYSTATWDESRSLKRFFYVEYRDDYFEEELEGAYNRFIENMTKAFVAGFEEDGRSVLKVVEGDADYTVSVVLTNFHDKRRMWNRYTLAYGEAEIVDNATGEVVCTLEIDGVEGDEIQNKAEGTVNCMEKVGWSISFKMGKTKKQ